MEHGDIKNLFALVPFFLPCYVMAVLSQYVFGSVHDRQLSV